MVYSLNGEGFDGAAKVSLLQKQVLEGLLEDCCRVVNWKGDGPAPSWAEFFKVKGVNYKGKEVLTAQVQVMSGKMRSRHYPIEVGTVPLEEVVDPWASSIDSNQ